MNRFLTKRKGKDDLDSSRPSIDSESSGPFRMFGKRRGQNEDLKPNVDLSTALPPSDDFRTSLLMTGLSARFSMLREQDDPNTKVGKASDDSVLYPKRQSRMADFGLATGLQDISEVESIKTPSLKRLDSFQTDNAGSNINSIMNRGKATEGNVLFGGRQKIYRIPANNTGTSKDGGMPGRALYDDDVAMSAFQKYRQAEKDRQAAEGSTDGGGDSENSLDASQRRMTNSTTSSVPSIAARYSTAATSIASQGASSIKEPQSTQPASASSNTTVERSVTRTRRLYEQGLSRELQDQQSSALSRMDTLSKGRAFGSLSPDLTSPSNGAFGDRMMERRQILAKASAPNLRSFSPPVSSTSSIFPTETTSKPSPNPEPKGNFGASPPLSPPISEAEELSMLPIQPNDRGKATAMGVFERPAQKYDDTKYTQRQRQLQQGRDSPTSPPPVEPPVSNPDATTRATSIPRKALGNTESRRGNQEPKVPDDAPSFFDDSNDSFANHVISASRPPQLSLERPHDEEHPAFRKSALPTPLSLGSKSASTTSLARPTVEASEDSPTLGPESGLSGMVRAHLRGDSNASSVYEPSEETEGSSENSQKSSTEIDTRTTSARAPFSGPQHFSRSPSHHAGSSDETDKDEDDFARHLADGARRVREKLTSIADAESDRSAPPTPQPQEVSKELNAPRANALGILRSKSSGASLFERQSREQSQSRSAKPAMPSPPVTTRSPSRKTSADGTDELSRGRSTQARDQPAGQAAAPNEKDDNVHVGLKAFRQARRELQKMKELEAKQRHQTGPGPERPNMSVRTASHDANGPPPAMFNRMPRDESRNGSGSRAASHAGSRTVSRAGSRAASERDRSGSETSNNGQPQIRPTRMRNGSLPYEEQNTPGSPSSAGWHSAGMRQTGSSSRQRSYEMGQQSPAAPPYGIDTRPRNGSILGSTASTPNLHSMGPAPPLPPINPRRKNWMARTSDDATLSAAPQIPGGFPGIEDSDDDMSMEQRRQRLRRATSEGNSLRTRNSPPRPNARPPMPPATLPHSQLPGGMI